MEIKTCCVIGGQNTIAKKLDFIISELSKEILSAIEDGYTHYISGFARGTDLFFASIVADLMTEYPSLTLEAAIPYRKRMNSLDPHFHQLISKCKTIGIHNEENTSASIAKRNRFMFTHSQRVIAVYDGRERGCTFNGIQFASSLGLEIRIIRI